VTSGPRTTTRPAAGALDPGTVAAIVEGRHDDPYAVLGVHRAAKGLIARAFVPGAEAVEALVDGKVVGTLERIDARGLFEGKLTLRKPRPIRLRVRNLHHTWEQGDPYSFGPVLGPMDDYFIGQGRHLRLFDRLGAHVMEHEGAIGVNFAVWAPSASRVSVVGDFNGWDGRRNVMRFRRDSGIWETFIPDLPPGTIYKYEILDKAGQPLPLKADPFAFQSELRPATGSIVARPFGHDWGDDDHRTHWSQTNPRREAVSIYEVHPGSWRRNSDGDFLTWDELADQLIPYVTDMGFTHIEFMPVSEHPYDPSWGYQTTGLYAPSARFGDPEGLARFIDGAHRAGIGVLLDWVPGHFPTDAHGLAMFDGTALYEHADPRKGFHPDWNTAIYNFGRTEVREFLINNALFWAERYHADGLRVDAVASMLYLDYSRKAGEWIPNETGGRENLEAISFLQDVNRELYRAHAGVMTMAEDSTAWPGVSMPVHEGGLGFGFKWNMGFMNDTLTYLSREAVHRKYHHHEMTFGTSYLFSENYVLPLSHDEVVHGKGTLLTKMSGDDWQKFATLRAYYAFMWGYPGKKLLFMGQEFAQRREWSEARALDWDLLDAPAHEGVRSLVRDLNRFYRGMPALHARDCEPEGFGWLLADETETSVYAWERRAPGAPPVVVVSNFTPVLREGYALPLPQDGDWAEMMNTDAAHYGGSNAGNGGRVRAKNGHATITLPPLATLYLTPITGAGREEPAS
jgi:1,4-alpha-glucan branching enzyme